MQNNKAAEIITERTNKGCQTFCSSCVAQTQALESQEILSNKVLYGSLFMERYYSTLKNLPTELLSSRLPSSSASLDEIKHSRWLTRDTFLQISQSPFAQANGIGSDHLYNFLDLQDALIVKMLIRSWRTQVALN